MAAPDGGDADADCCLLAVERALSCLPPDLHLLVFRALLSWLPVAALGSQLWLRNKDDAVGHSGLPAVIPYGVIETC